MYCPRRRLRPRRPPPITVVKEKMPIRPPHRS
jgi:hypothetical protein